VDAESFVIFWAENEGAGDVAHFFFASIWTNEIKAILILMFF